MKRKLQTGHGNGTLQMTPPDIFVCDHVACTILVANLQCHLSRCLCLYGGSRSIGVLVQADADYDLDLLSFSTTCGARESPFLILKTLCQIRHQRAK